MSSSVRYCAKCSYLFLKFILVIYATIFWVSLLLSIIFIAGYTLLSSDFTRYWSVSGQSGEDVDFSIQE